MIKYKTTETENFYIEGFSASISEPFTLKISNGKTGITFLKNVPSLIKTEPEFIRTTEVDEFPNIEFEVEPDSMMDVVYDIYLMSTDDPEEKIHVDRTELSEGTFPYYQGNGQLKHTLCSFLVPAGTTSLKDIEITINLMKVKETNEDNSK